MDPGVWLRYKMVQEIQHGCRLIQHGCRAFSAASLPQTSKKRWKRNSVERLLDGRHNIKSEFFHPTSAQDMSLSNLMLRLLRSIGSSFDVSGPYMVPQHPTTVSTGSPFQLRCSSRNRPSWTGDWATSFRWSSLDLATSAWKMVPPWVGVGWCSWFYSAFWISWKATGLWKTKWCRLDDVLGSIQEGLWTSLGPLDQLEKQKSRTTKHQTRPYLLENNPLMIIFSL